MFCRFCFLTKIRKIGRTLLNSCSILTKYFRKNFPRMQQLSGAFTELSGIGTSSAGVCIWPIDPRLASSCARPAAVLRDLWRARRRENMVLSPHQHGCQADGNKMHEKEAPKRREKKNEQAAVLDAQLYPRLNS